MLSTKNFKKIFRPKLDLAMQPEKLLRELPGSRAVQERSLLRFREYSEKLLTEDLEAFQKEEMSKLSKPRLDAIATGRTSTIEGLEENQKKAFLEFREYSRKFLTNDLRSFKQNRKDQIFRTLLLSGELGRDKSFRGFLASLLVGVEGSKEEDELSLPAVLFLVLILGVLSWFIFLLVVGSILEAISEDLVSASSFSLTFKTILIGLPILLVTVTFWQHKYRFYTYRLRLENPLYKLLETFEQLPENRQQNSVNEVFSSGRPYERLPETKEELMGGDLYLIINEHLTSSAKKFLEVIAVPETPEKIAWLTCRELYEDKLGKLPREKEVSPSPKLQKLKMKLISLKSPEKEPVASSQEELTEELGSFFAKS